MLQVSWNLYIGSGGCKGTRQTNEDYLLVSNVIRQVDRLRRKPKMELERRGDLVTHFDGSSRGGEEEKNSAEAKKDFHGD